MGTDVLSTFVEAFSHLYPLETFEKQVFQDGDKDVQAVCNFILALALVYNDAKNYELIHAVLNASRPKDLTVISRERGEFAGLKIFLSRGQISLVYELLNLIRENTAALEHPLFKESFRLMDNKSHECLENLIIEAQGKPASTAVGKLLLLIRNKVTFHYDEKEIGRGYKQFFLDQGSNEPFVSRGQNMLESRFYFADAAAEGYFQSRLEGMMQDDFFKEVSSLLNDINTALFKLVLNFIQKRGAAWREYK